MRLNSIDKSEYDKLIVPSYSLMKLLEEHPTKCKDAIDGVKKKTTTALFKGSLVDDCISGNTDDYLVTTLKPPKEKALDWANEFISIISESEFTTDEETAILTARDISGYNKNLTRQVALNKFKEECYDWTKLIIDNPDKIIVHQYDWDFANRLAYDVELDIYHSKMSTECTHDLKQLRLCNTVNNGLVYKGIMDRVFIFEHKKLVIIVDYKTDSDGSFLYNYINYKYPLQESLYIELIKSLLPDYNISYLYCVIDKTLRRGIEWFKSNNNNVNNGFFGGVLEASSYKSVTKGVDRLGGEFYQHIDRDNWMHPIEHIINGYMIIK